MIQTNTTNSKMSKNEVAKRCRKKKNEYHNYILIVNN